MKERFLRFKEKSPGICKIVSDFYERPKKKGSVFFVKSPATTDKHWSLCLYPNTNRFTDFANGGLSGDCIAFVAYVRGCNNWEALKMLEDFYGLSDSEEQSHEEMKRKIRLQQERERKVAERKAEFWAALSGCIEDLKAWANIYRIAMEKTVFEPFTDEWCYCLEELQKIDYRLDILCCADCETYMRLKSNADLGLKSDRFQWLLDALVILADCGQFKATDAELEEIKAQAAFELTRNPGRDRRCSAGW